MGTIFRTATTQAILDIIGEHGTRSRFGHLLNDEDIQTLASRVVDLFEMTLELRSRTGMLGSNPPNPDGSDQNQMHRQSAQSSPVMQRRSLNGAARRSWSEEETSAPFPTTVNASDFFDNPRSKTRVPETPSESDDPGAFTLKLPRQRKPIPEEERLGFLKRRS